MSSEFFKSHFKIFLAIFLFFFLAFFAIGCRQENQKISFKEISDFNNPKVKIAGITDILATREARRLLPKATYLEYLNPVDLIIALRTYKVDAIVSDRPTLEYASIADSEVMVMPQDLTVGHIAIGAPLYNQELINRVNEYLRAYKKDGTYEDMYHRWINVKNSSLPDIKNPEKPDGILNIGITADNVPFCFIKNGEYTGFDIELALRLGLFLNKKINFVNLTYEAIPTAIQEGKIDLAIALLDVLPERKSEMLFSDEYVESPISLMIRKSDHALLKFSSIENLNGKRIGCLTGSIFDEAVREKLKDVKISSFTQMSSQVTALENDKLDAMILDEPEARYLLSEKKEFKILNGEFRSSRYATAFSKKHIKIRDEFSKEILKLKADGTLGRLQEKWFDSANEKNQTMPTSLPGKKTLVIGVYAEGVPFVFIRDGKYVGYELELATLIGNKLGYGIKIVQMDMNALVNALEANKIDMICGGIIDTPEREENIAFTESIYDGRIIAVAKNNDKIKEDTSVFADLKNSFYKTFIHEGRWKLIAEGLVVTIIITVFSVVLGTILAFPVCGLCSSRKKIFRLIGEKYVSTIQGTPILVLLMIFYYIIFAKIEISAIIVAILAFGIDLAAYVGVMLKSSIDAVPVGQKEASLALGFSKKSTFIYFILPQAVRLILPVYRGEVISVLKGTAIVGYIAIMDLTRASDIIRSRTYDAFFPLIATAIIYFMIAKILAWLILKFEKSLTPQNRRDRIIKREMKKAKILNMK